MSKRILLSPSDDTASRALVNVQTAITHVKEIVSEGVSKGWSEKELTTALNKVIASECKRVDVSYRESFRKSLVSATRKWHYELSKTYKILDQNFAAAAMKQPLNIEIQNLIKKVPFEKFTEFRRLLDDGTNPGIPVIKDYQKSVRLITKAISVDAPKTVTTKNGKSYVMPVRLRAELAVRYAAAVENLQRLIDSGVKWCWISSHANCSPRCADYQGRLYSLFKGEHELDGKIYKLTGTIDGIPYRPITEALLGPNGDGNGCISGYNCRHRAIEYERGSKPPKDFTEAEMKREYAIDKQQRFYENRIRQMKTEERQLRACGMTKEAATLRKKWRALTLDYEIYSVEHDRAYYPYRCVIDRAEENILTNTESDGIILNEQIRTAVGEYTVGLQQAIDNTPELIRNAFKKNQQSLKILDAHYQTTANQVAHFSPSEEGIRFNIEEDCRPSDENRMQYQTYFHETGHNLDYVLGKKLLRKGYASSTYESPNHTEEIFYRDKNGQVVGKTMRMLSFDDMIKKEGNAFIEVYRDLVEGRIGKKASKREVYNEIYQDFKGEPIANVRQLSDILDGITNGEIRRLGYSLGASHTRRNPDYWKTHSVGSEAFAHFTSVISCNKKMEEKYRAYFPKAFQIYEEILKL